MISNSTQVAQFLPITSVLIIVHCLSFFYTLMLMPDTCGHVQFISMWASVWKFMHQALVEAGWQKTRQGESFLFYLIYYTSRSAQYFHVVLHMFR